LQRVVFHALLPGGLADGCRPRLRGGRGDPRAAGPWSVARGRQRADPERRRVAPLGPNQVAPTGASLQPATAGSGSDVFGALSCGRLVTSSHATSVARMNAGSRIICGTTAT